MGAMPLAAAIGVHSVLKKYGDVDSKVGGQVILVTGQMRTGTTCVARILNSLGCQMGTTMRMPLPFPNCDHDFEDFQLVEAITSGQFDEDWFMNYCDLREHQRQRVIDMGYPVAAGWGMKSPFLMEHVADIESWLPEPTILIQCKRDQVDSEESLDRMLGESPRNSQFVATANKGIAKAEERLRTPDMVIEFEDMVDNLMDVIEKLAVMVKSPYNPRLVFNEIVTARYPR